MQTGTLKDTYGIAITFAGTDVSLYLDPKTVTPFGADGGDAIDNTTLSNTRYKTKSPGTLVEMLDGGFTAAYDPSELAAIYGLINENVLITITYADATAEAIYGFLKSFVPNEHGERVDATAECVIVPTMNNAGTETAPA